MNDLRRKRNMNETKNRSMVYDDYDTVRRIGQIMRVCGHDVGFMDSGCIPAINGW